MIAPKAVLLASVLAIAGAAAAAADHGRAERIDEDQAKQSSAIETGRYNGGLTRREYRELQAEQARIRDLEARAKADGHVSRQEFREIRDAQTNADQHIKAEADDGQISFWRRWLYRSRY